MRLLNLSYGEYLNTDKAWEFESFDLNTINLVVGKNASGKSRVLHTIHGLSKLFVNDITPFANVNYSAMLEHAGRNYQYNVEIAEAEVRKESLFIDNHKYLDRDAEGTGKIRGEEIKDFIKFKIPKNQLAISRRDEIQHPTLDALYWWASELKYLPFTGDLDKRNLIIPNSINIDLKNNSDSIAIAIFEKGKAEFNQQFEDAIIQDMKDIGYQLESIEFGKMQDIKILQPFPSELFGLLIKEKDLQSKISQLNMSDGMFRALASLIHFNYYSLKKEHGLVVIDDIGEGLDFDRATKLIKKLVAKAEETDIQLIMSTNDKFVMNSVPLKYWQILNRNGSHIKILNSQNTREIFDEFRFTGLNNFDFFSGDFINGPMEDEI